MSLKDRFANLFIKSTNKLYRNLFSTISLYPLGNDDAEQQIDKGYLYNPDVYSVVNKITHAAKAVKWELYEVKDSQKHNQLRYATKQAQITNPIQAIKTKSEAYNKITDRSNQLYRLLMRPNPMQGFSEWIENVLGYKLITGETFIHGVKLRNGINAGLINEMWTMPAQLMEIKASKNKVIEAYVLRNITSNAGVVTFNPEEVLHLKYFNPDFTTNEAHLRGLSPLRAASRVVRQSNDAYTANAALLQNAGASGILSLDPEDFYSPEQAMKLKDTYEQNYGGVNNRGKIIMASGKMKWEQIGLSPVDLNIIESQKMSLRDLCDVYGISSALFNDPDNNAFSNMQEARKALYMEKVFPELDSLRDELNRWLVETYNEVMGTSYYLDYDINSVPAIQDDMKKIVERFWNAWWLTGNERRVAMGFDWDEAMERYFIPTGMMPMSREQLMEGLGIFDDRGNGSASMPTQLGNEESEEN